MFSGGTRRPAAVASARSRELGDECSRPGHEGGLGLLDGRHRSPSSVLRRLPHCREVVRGAMCEWVLDRQGARLPGVADESVLRIPDDDVVARRHPLAEEIGYERAWLYDTPQQSPDVWMSLALAAERTIRIGLGPGVLVPNLRHPMTNAAATATLVGLAPGRVAVSFGTGFTGRRAMGYRAIPWSFMTAYIDAYCRPAPRRDRRVGGRPHADAAPRRQRTGPPDRRADPDRRPRRRRVGPIGRATHDGVFATMTLEGLEPGAFDWVAYLYWGTVLDAGEDVSSERVLAAAGPGGALAYHATYELYGRDAVPDIPARQGVAGRHRRAAERRASPRRPRRATASTSTTPTGRRGQPRADRCCRRRRSPAPPTRSGAASTSSASRASPRSCSSRAAPTFAASSRRCTSRRTVDRCSVVAFQCRGRTFPPSVGGRCCARSREPDALRPDRRGPAGGCWPHLSRRGRAHVVRRSPHRPVDPRRQSTGHDRRIRVARDHQRPHRHLVVAMRNTRAAGGRSAVVPHAGEPCVNGGQVDLRARSSSGRGACDHRHARLVSIRSRDERGRLRARGWAHACPHDRPPPVVQGPLGRDRTALRCACRCEPAGARCPLALGRRCGLDARQLGGSHRRGHRLVPHDACGQEAGGRGA